MWRPGPALGALVAGVVLTLTVLAPSASVAPAAPVPLSGATTPAGPPGPSVTVEMAPAYAPAAGVRDLGPAGPGTSLTVDVGLASRDPSGLDAFVNATEVPGTSLYRQFLSAASASERFGALASSVAAAEGYFASYGLSTAVHPDGLILSVSGPAPAVARAFDTTLDTYRTASGATFVAHPTAASLPGVAPWTGVLGLDTETAFAPEVVAAPAPAAVAPSEGCTSVDGDLSACELATAYDLAGLEAAGTNGTGKRIAVVDTYTPDEDQADLASDLARFSSAEGLPAASVSFRYPVPTTTDLNASGANAVWADEDALDLQWAHAAAPGAALTMVFSPDASTGLYFAIDWIVAQDAANVISMSWGEPEVGIFNAVTTPCSAACNASTDGSFAILNPVLELASAEGIGSFAASGDCGSADGTSGVAVNYPASDPYVTGVGATNLTFGAGGTYVSEAAWGGNGSGAVGAGCQNLGGSGGGFSVLPRPAWQAGNGTVPSRGRGVPDVAIVGGAQDPALVFQAGSALALYGTSLATPIWAGIEAVADQAYGGDLGSLNPSLYRILRSSHYTDDFHPITSGSNGYRTHTGWNPVTGIGTPIVGNLTADLLRTLEPPSNLSTFVYASPRFGSAPLTVDFAVTASGGSGAYRLEGVNFGDGNASATVGGTVEHTFVTSGVFSAQAYVIDSSGNVSASPPVVVDVGGEPLSVTLVANNTTPAVGTNVSFTATVTGSSAPLLYNFSFGDGAFLENVSASSVVYAYPLGGAYCAEVVVRTTTAPANGAASARVPVAVGGATASTCGNPSQPLTLVPNGTPAARDAPADFPSLFRSTGGSTAPDGLLPEVGFASADLYSAACACSILRAAGNYTIQEWENDSVGEEATAAVNVTVEPALQAVFGASALAGTVPLSVQFATVVSGGYLADAADTHWRFGDGQGAVGATARATYTTPGEYVAVASLSDGGDGNASEAFLIDAESVASPGVGLTGTVTPAVNVSSGTTVDYTAIPVGSASALAGTVVAWDLGNGGHAFGPAANETYLASAGVPSGDELGASVTLESAALAPVVRVPIDLPDFFANETGGFVPSADALELTADLPSTEGVVPVDEPASATARGPGGTTVQWQFGDGDTAAGTAGAHVYYAAGRYTLRVQATDGFSDAAAELQTVVVNPALTLQGCGPGSRSGSAPYSLTLAPTATGGTGPPYSYTWTLPNGTTSNATSLALTFDHAGTYAVALTVQDTANASFGCSWSVVVTAVPAELFVWVLTGAVAAGILLAGVFVWATRPRDDD